MIESFNNVIFYTGYFCITGLFLWIGFGSYLKCYEILMNRKWFFKLIFDSALIKSFRNTSDENFEKWIDRRDKSINNLKIGNEMKDRKVIMPDKWALIRNIKTKELEFKPQLVARPKSDGAKGFPIHSFRIS